jgi:hypothetical protein
MRQDDAAGAHRPANRMGQVGFQLLPRPDAPSATASPAHRSPHPQLLKTTIF